MIIFASADEANKMRERERETAEWASHIKPFNILQRGFDSHIDKSSEEFEFSLMSTLRMLLQNILPARK